MITDIDLAKLALDTYAITPAGEVYDAGNDRAVITRFPDVTVLSFMGTNSPALWISDFKIKGVVPAAYPLLGACESGFLAGALALYPILAPVLGEKPLIVQGHSRGAGMVPIFAALVVIDRKVTIQRCICWEAPWCVGHVCRDLLLAAGVDGVQYWHGDDPVPTIPAVTWLVSHVWPIKHFGVWKLNPFDCHLMGGIVAELLAASPTVQIPLVPPAPPPVQL